MLWTVFRVDGGFSPGDFFANTVGASLALSQDLVWQDQRVRLKWSFTQTNLPQYSTSLGSSSLDYWLHDYNGQTYWLSANLRSFFKETKIPRLLNVAVGYGAQNMIEEYSNPPGLPKGLSSAPRYRQYYLSLDLDLSRIKTKSKFIKILLEVANGIKIPSPTLEYTSQGNLKFHYLYF